MIHELKCHPVSFVRLKDGTKTFEVRVNDRMYQAGDLLHLREWAPSVHPVSALLGGGGYTGEELWMLVSFVASGEVFGLDLDVHVILAVRPTSKPAELEAS